MVVAAVLAQDTCRGILLAACQILSHGWYCAAVTCTDSTLDWHSRYIACVLPYMCRSRQELLLT